MAFWLVQRRGGSSHRLLRVSLAPLAKGEEERGASSHPHTPPLPPEGNATESSFCQDITPPLLSSPLYSRLLLSEMTVK
ncbi:hypothetical protein EYF80_050231 [Liparis tanakae]|uniref:Uncharacterized protein n=1 Tax=Liparis tanakae TaxID=230148 RepID=A0A4Z2FF75_9TELE|nr:hypothetical protein EYF80_050231 [Liparis tanakae]